MEMSLANILSSLTREVSEIQRNPAPSSVTLLEWSRLWNTVSYYADLYDTTEGSRFDRQFVDLVLPGLSEKLDMQISRGMSLHSAELDFTVGGLLDEKYRFRVPELEDRSTDGTDVVAPS